MKKLTLDLNTLHVESFVSSPAPKRREGGTVKAHAYTEFDCFTLPYDQVGGKDTDYTFCGSCYCQTDRSCYTQNATDCGTCAFPVCQRF
jgi:hypothetical protein